MSTNNKPNDGIMNTNSWELNLHNEQFINYSAQ